MGRMWNEKPCECRFEFDDKSRCGKTFENVLKGRVHVDMEHGVAWRRTRKYLRLRR